MNVIVPASENSYSIQERLGRICRQTLPQVLERVCNAICMEDYWIKLNKIRLDLGTLHVAELEESLSETVAEKLSAILTTAIGSEVGYLNGTDPENTFDTSVMEETTPFLVTSISPESNDMKRKNTPAAPVKLLKYFLSTGALPVWIDSRSVVLEQLLDKAMTAVPGEISRFLRDTPHKNKLCKRLAIILKETQLKALVSEITQTNAWDTLIDALFAPGHTDTATERAHPVKIKESLLSYVLHYGSEKLPGSILKKKDTNAPLSEQQALKMWIAKQIEKGYIFKGGALQKELMQQPGGPVQVHTTKKGPENTADSILHTHPEARNGWNHEKQHISFPGNEARPCTVHNAGLVILWPGIPSLLEVCGLTRENAFVGEAAAERAVLLLQYAVDGRMEVPEFELPLNKILCGLPIDTPVATAFEPTAIEKAAVQDLLQSVIAEWSALKNSSPEALQQNYLQREGAISPRGDHFQLNVKRQTLDILLDQLPWGIWVVKLPWMHQILYTEW